MGIFKEDLLNFRNLIDSEIEIKLRSTDFERAFPGLRFQLSSGLLKITGRRKALLRRRFEFRAREEERGVFGSAGEGDMGILLRVVDPSGSEELGKRKGMSFEGDTLRLSISDLLRETETYRRIPDVFRNRLKPVRYRIGKGCVTLYLRVR